MTTTNKNYTVLKKWIETAINGQTNFSKIDMAESLYTQIKDDKIFNFTVDIGLIYLMLDNIT